MNYGLIFAGGTGQRMNSKSIPKQFLLVHGKEIIIHTIEVFERNELIDEIYVVCYGPYIELLKALLKKYNIKKVKAIIPGGETGQESIFKGISEIIKHSNKNDIVLIHDGVRPLINDKLIADNIDCVQKNGNAITTSLAIETVVDISGYSINNVYNRANCAYAKAPQSFYTFDIYSLYKRAFDDHRVFIDSASIAYYYGKKLYFVDGPVENIKITTQLDFYTFRAILDAKENNQLKDEIYG